MTYHLYSGDILSSPQRYCVLYSYKFQMVLLSFWYSCTFNLLRRGTSFQMVLRKYYPVIYRTVFPFGILWLLAMTWLHNAAGASKSQS